MNAYFDFYYLKLLIGFIIIVFLVKILIIRKKHRIKGDEIPEVSKLPMLFTILRVFINKPKKDLNICYNIGILIIQTVTGLCHLYQKQKIFKGYWAGYNFVCLFHPEMVEGILKSSTVINKGLIYKILHPWLGLGLLTSSDNLWRTRRKLLTPAFHFRILEDFIHVFNEQSLILIKKLKSSPENEKVEMSEMITNCTLDIIADSAMGVRLKIQECFDCPYAQAVKSITYSLVDSFGKPWFWFPPFFYLSETGRIMRKNISYVHEFARKVIHEKKCKLLEEIQNDEIIDDFQEDREVAGIKRRRAFLDLLLYHHIMDGSISEEEIREEVDTFMFEGHDTTAMGINWTLHLLGLYPEVQKKVQEELHDIFGEDKDRSVTNDDLKKMKYLECVIKESLRLYPSVPYILRRSYEDVQVDNYTIPANSTILIYIYGIHHNPDVYPNPEVFDPDRFLQENCEKRHPFAFVPFSAGPRNCIGQRFAMMEIKTVSANIIRNFYLRSIETRDKMFPAGDIILRPKFGLNMMLKRRS